MSFEDFMALALYDPRYGYYGANINDVGNGRGDFATTATLSSGLGKAIARWIRSEIEHHRWRAPVQVIEVGPGSGDLAAEVLKQFGWFERKKLKFHLVEVSPTLTRRQQKKLKRKGVSWHASIEGALKEAKGEALIYSNELFDAFPVKWLRWSEEAKQWEEIFVSYSEGEGLKEFWKTVPESIDPEQFSAMRLRKIKEGQRIEIQPAVRQWITELSTHWEAGSMLSVDYGGDPHEIYDRSPAGTVRGYFRNERISGGGVYSRFGKQDLTVDVNFADLESWGEEAGMETVFRETQRDFLLRQGIENDPLIESGAAEEFQVFLQRRSKR